MNEETPEKRSHKKKRELSLHERLDALEYAAGTTTDSDEPTLLARVNDLTERVEQLETMVRQTVSPNPLFPTYPGDSPETGG